MKDILDRLNDLFDSFYRSGGDARRDSGDPYFDEAWQELDRFLAGGGAAAPRRKPEDLEAAFAELRRRSGGKPEEPGPRPGPDGRPRRPADPLEELARQLVRDYHNLEIKPGAPAAEVRAAYKKMIKQYHPDRFADDPAKQETATQISAKLNQSYDRIMKHLGAG